MQTIARFYKQLIKTNIMTDKQRDELLRARLVQFRKEAKERGVTLYRVFKNTKIPPQAVKDIENGKRKGGCVYHTLFKLMTEYGRTMEELFKGIE